MATKALLATSKNLDEIKGTGRTMKRFTVLACVAIMVLPTTIFASSDTATQLMGGAIQGKAITVSGVVTALAGNAEKDGSADGPGAKARFSYPQAVTTDGINLYVADMGTIEGEGNNTIRKIVIATGVVSTLAGTANKIGSANGIGPAARFEGPMGITTDGTNLYVADTDNNTIRKIVIATRVVTTLAGSAGTPGHADGVGTAATFDMPAGITTDGTSLYVTDQMASTVRKIVIATGEVTTLAGSAGTRGHADGTGTTATFHDPTGITTDGINLFVADSDVIRKIVIATGEVTTLPSSGGGNGLTTDGTKLFVSGSYYIYAIQ